MTSDGDLLHQISGLVQEEHALRGGTGAETDGGDQAQRRLAELEVALDQCWDLLRQRQALRTAGQDPEKAAVRPADQVENYLG